MYLIAASPLTKIFLQDYRDRLVENPEWISDPKYSFTFNIPFGSGAVGPFTYNRLTRLDDLPCVRRRDPADIPNLYNLLTGGKGGNEFPGSREMDAYGIAAISLPTDVTALNMQMTEIRLSAREAGNEKALKAADQEILKIQRDIDEAMIAAVSGAKKISDEKVMRKIKETYERLKDQWHKQKQRGEGNHEASSCEANCVFILSDWIKQSNDKKQKMNATIAEMLDFIQTTKV